MAQTGSTQRLPLSLLYYGLQHFQGRTFELFSGWKYVLHQDGHRHGEPRARDGGGARARSFLCNTILADHGDTNVLGPAR